MDELLHQLLDELERIGEEHSEIYDTDVREQMFQLVFDGLIVPQSDFRLPTRVGMYSDQANARVLDALQRYLVAAAPRAAIEGLATPAARLMAFQNANVVTSGAGQTPDEFFGWLPPDKL